MADSVETLGVYLRTSVKRLGGKRKKRGGRIARLGFRSLKVGRWEGGTVKVGVWCQQERGKRMQW